MSLISKVFAPDGIFGMDRTLTFHHIEIHFDEVISYDVRYLRQRTVFSKRECLALLAKLFFMDADLRNAHLRLGSDARAS
jgi:hypothetical protein